MPRYSDKLSCVYPELTDVFLGDPRVAATAAPRALKVAGIIACAPKFPLDEIEEDLFLLSLDDVRDLISDKEIN